MNFSKILSKFYFFWYTIIRGEIFLRFARGKRFNIMSNKGFSLIELALALIVIGLLVTPFMHDYNLYSKRKISEQTELSQRTVLRAMNDFFEANDRFPCPANLALDEDDLNHGEENCTLPPGAPAPGACIFGGGVCRASGRDADGVIGPDPILIGGVPYATLNIPVNMSLDGYRRKMTYAVTETMTDAATYNESSGAITIQEWDGDDLSPPIPGSPPIPNSQPYLVVSHGSNGVGAFTASGNLVQACPNPAVSAEDENCDNDSTFETPGLYINTAGREVGARSLAAGVDYNDDEVLFNISGGTGLWVYTPADPEDIHFNNEGNVGINQDDPQEKLDVGGNIKADTVHAITYCDDAGNCFPPEMIGGDGIRCSNAPNEAMTGVANSNSLCNIALPAGSVTNPGGGAGDPPCPAGSFATGLKGGVIQCTAAP